MLEGLACGWFAAGPSDKAFAVTAATMYAAFVFMGWMTRLAAYTSNDYLQLLRVSTKGKEARVMGASAARFTHFRN
jgi:hypothetical protein